MPFDVATANATFCATLVDQWVAEGLQAAFIAPGSRSTPLALAFAARDDLAVELFHDERSASFAALGHGWATETPAAIVCTSGTAAAHFYAAVIEADLSAIPILVCTADRPPELWDRGAPQTIDQTDLYGHRVRAFFQPGCPDDTPPADWRPLARSAWNASLGRTPGPVHLNLSFREPLAGTADPLPQPLAVVEAAPTSTPAAAIIDDLIDRLTGRRGVIVAGRGESAPDDVLRLAERLGWPVLADHRSGCRRPGHPNVVHRYDSLLRHDGFTERNRPETVVRVGEIVSSKAVSLWLRSLGADGADVITSRPHGRHIDPEAIATLQIDESGVVHALAERLDGYAEGSADVVGADWVEGWRRADEVAERAVVASLPDETNEIAVARTVIESVPTGGHLVVASSMPVRDVEWFGPPRDDIAVISNRGANGIDGTIATAIGVALTGAPTTVLVGDVALLHDSSSLAALANRDIDLTIVVVDNDGGGIFSFLPQHDQLDHRRYEQLFGTPHGTDLVALARAHGLEARPFDEAELAERGGVRTLVATTDRGANLTLHQSVHAAVAAAYDELPTN